MIDYGNKTLVDSQLWQAKVYTWSVGRRCLPPGGLCGGSSASRKKGSHFIQRFVSAKRTPATANTKRFSRFSGQLRLSAERVPCCDDVFDAGGG